MEWWTSDVVDYEDRLISPKDDPFPLGATFRPRPFPRGSIKFSNL